MSGKSERAKGAEVRASRARSRVEARKHARDAARKAEHRPALRAPVARKRNREEGAVLEVVADVSLPREKEKKPARRSRKKQHAVVEVRQAKAEKGKGKKEAQATDGKKAAGGSSMVRTAVLGTVLVISLGVLLWVYTGTGVLNVKHVEVKGNEVLETDYLRSLSGITADTHLLKMDVKAVEKALLSEPYIASVDISRGFPNTVVIEVSERQPSGAILQNGRYYLVDQEGMVLGNAEAIPPGLVEIKGLQLPLLLPGTEISGLEFASVTSLLGSLPPALRDKTAAVGLSKAEGLYLEAGGTIVIYGEANDFSRKNTIALMALSTLMQQYGSVDYIDVTYPDHPVIKPAAAG